MNRSSLANWPHWPWAVWGAYTLALAAVKLMLPALPQDPNYHHFADTRSWMGIPRFGDVASNAVLLIGGLAGLAALRRRTDTEPVVRTIQFTFFAAVALTSMGSAYYHWAPDSSRLVWDRLPLALVASCFPALVLADRAQLSASSRWALAVWLAWGPLTVAYWFMGEALGTGDLWPYYLVKLFSVAAALALLAVLPARHSLGWVYLVGLALYVLAGVTEAKDAAIFDAIGVVSGHTLKHLLAGVGVAALAAMVVSRSSILVARP